MPFYFLKPQLEGSLSISGLTWEGCLSQLHEENNVRDENESVAFDLLSLILLFPFRVHVRATQVTDELW